MMDGLILKGARLILKGASLIGQGELIFSIIFYLPKGFFFSFFFVVRSWEEPHKKQ